MRLSACIIAGFLAVFDCTSAHGAADTQLKNRAAIVASHAYAWLAGYKHDEDFEPDVIWIYDYLMRKYALPELRQVARFRAEAMSGRYNSSGFSPILHVLSPGAGRAPDLNGAGAHPIDKATFGALWCDRIDLPTDYISQLDALAAHGEYALTHVYLAMQLLKERNCPYYTSRLAALNSLEAKLKREMAALPQKTGKTGDLEIEAAAFYAFANAGQSLSDKFLRQAVAFGEQRLVNRYAVRMRPHTVVLLLWFLLEHLAPGAPPAKLSGPVK